MYVARDFSLMLQSCGMTAATFTIIWMRVQLEWNSIILCSLEEIVGMVIGLEFIDPNLTPSQKKIGFVCVWFSFAFALFLLNRYHKRKTYKTIPDFKMWKLIVLLHTGFIGGIFSAISGSGLDICSFSILTLLFRITEKTATPTSVVLMAGNSLVGFYWRQRSDFSSLASSLTSDRKPWRELKRDSEELQQVQINSDEDAKEKGMKPDANKNLNGKRKYEVHELDTHPEA
ncbi:hypothetical protein OS493_013351 [Desmophyllum pertusum]|uniref:Uncharacterized protein n=1 Tax=Desmophyllum pertusum TaxID=174260 RepID=A0A9X0CEY4_9CNID|nr:hypothetical protein OS493_013351 [Desmophyllum pertusum]